MTKKHELALTLIAMNQVDLTWELGMLIVSQQLPQIGYIELGCVPIEPTLTRHSDTLAQALDLIVDKLGQGIKI